MKDPRIVVNAVMAMDGTIIQSFRRHDFKKYTPENGLYCFVDGGLDYIRYGGECIPITLTEESDILLLRNLLFVAVKDRGLPLRLLGDELLEKTINQLKEKSPDSRFLTVYLKEKEYRKKNHK